MIINKEIKDICKRRKFLNFWEAFDYFSLASYPETEALMISTKLFKGDIWGGVINASKVERKSSFFGDSEDFTNTFSSGATYYLSVDNALTLSAPQPSYDDDNIIVRIFYLTKDGDKTLKSIYKSYIDIRHYEPNEYLEKHIKYLTLNLKTHLSINLFNSGYKNI